MVMEEYNLYSMGQYRHTTLGATSRMGVVVILLLTSCAYHTEIPCSFGLTMKQLDLKCDFIQHGSTSNWVLKKEK